MKIFVKVKPKAKENKIDRTDENHFVVWVKEAPEKGRANVAVLKILARYFEIPVSSVELISGQTSKNKVFEVSI